MQDAPIDERLPRTDVLIVDDDRDVRAFLASGLESFRAVTRTAATAAEAVQAIHECWPDVLLADVRMLGENAHSQDPK
jgi:CheY-like chemotaxis protein